MEERELRPSTKPYVVIPTYQEAENIETVVRQIFDAVPNAIVLVVDDSSPDNTAEIAGKLALQGLGVEVMTRPTKSGLGSAYKEGFARAIENGATAAVEIDADLSHDPSMIPSLLEALDDGASLAIGSRYVEGGSSPGLSWGRLALSRGGNYYASLTLGLPVKDSTSGFRAYRAELLKRMRLTEIHADGYGFQVEMAYEVHRLGGVIKEIPITFRNRAAGGSKMSLKIVAEAMVLCTIWGMARVIGWPRSTSTQDRLIGAFDQVYDFLQGFSKRLVGGRRR